MRGLTTAGVDQPAPSMYEATRCEFSSGAGYGLEARAE
jgi:hypothetical protein